MALQLSLRQKCLIIGTIMVVATILNNVMAFQTAKKIDNFGKTIREASALTQSQMDNDMMHDAIRADVIALQDAVQRNRQDMYENAAKELKTHVQRLEQTIASLDVSVTPKELQTMFAEVEGQFKEYGKLAKDVASVGLSPAIDGKAEPFMKQFKVLEGNQQKLSDALDEWQNALTKESDAEVSAGELQMIIFAVINVLLGTGMQLFVSFAVFKPLSQMMSAMKEIADGKTSTEIPHTQRKDEMGEMARTVQVFKDNALRVAKMAEDQKRQQDEAEQQKKKALRELADNFESNVKGVVDMVAAAATQMDATSKSVAQFADRSQNSLSELTGQLDGTSRNVQSVAGATNQLSSAVSEITKQVSRATTITTTAVSEAQRADGTAQGLTEATQKIGEVVEMINGIAAQINLLALNATIEAARAGEAGKGFAVVASEVKNLATQTTKATEQIGEYITSIQGATSDTVGVIKTIGNTIREINEISTAIAAAVEEQGAVTRDIASNVQQAAQGTEEVTRNARDVSSTSRETGESAGQLSTASGELSRQSETLRNEVDKFLAGVRHG